ncbi:41916_t:CDS:2, partial [Gigaspora margarita]
MTKSSKKNVLYVGSFSELDFNTDNVTVDFEHIHNNNVKPLSLYSEKKFATWELCETFLNEWAKFQGFHIIKDRVQYDNEETYQHFLNDFYCYRNSLSKNAFEKYFNNLIQDFSNAKSYLEYLYKSKDHWAHCFIKYKFTGSMIATSHIESVNGCLKNFVLLRKQYQLRFVILDNLYFDYRFWCAAIPNAQNQDKVNFLFTKVDQCLQQYLKPTILKILYDQINQLVYYTANKISQQDIKTNENLLEIQEDSVNKPQTTLDQIIEFVGLHNYSTDITGSEEPFLMADKFIQDMITSLNNSSISYLYLFKEEKADFKNLNPQLQNPKKCKEKDHPLGTKRLKSFCEAIKSKVKQQYRCKKC